MTDPQPGPTTGRQPPLGRDIVGAVVWILALTGAYVAIPARDRMDAATVVIVLLHALLGLLAFPLLAAVSLRRAGQHHGRLAGRPSPPSLALFGIVRGGLLMGAALIGALMIVGATQGRVVSRAAQAGHELLGFGALAATGFAYLAARYRNHREQQGGRGHSKPVRRFPPEGVLLLAFCLLVALGSSVRLGSEEPIALHYQPEEYYSNLTATNFRQARNSLFPAGTRIQPDVRSQVRSTAYCGTAGCHPETYHQWLHSAHRQAARDPAYQQLAAHFGGERGGAARRWCDGCHDPGALAAGLSSGKGAIGIQEGVNCFTCHAVSRVPDLTGNGRLVLDIPAAYPFADSADRRLQWLHGFLVRLRPAPHRQAFLKQSLQPRSEFCSACHRMSYNLPQNDYKFLRTEDEYGTWQTGPNSGQSLHGFGAPGPVRRCQDCHEPHRGGPGPWALPVSFDARGEIASRSSPTPTTVTLDILALRRSSRIAGAAEELTAPIERAAPLARPGKRLTIDVVVHNRGAGHEFPAGVGNLDDVWLEFEVCDRAGRPLLRSGGLGPRGEIDTGAHTYGMIGLDRAGRRVEQGDFWHMITPLYHRPILPGQPDLDRRTIQPGESDVVRYRLNAPSGALGPLTLRARLWRRRPSAHPGQPLSAPAQARLGWQTTLVAKASVAIPLADESRKNEPVQVRSAETSVGTDAELPERFYNYGVGLLLQGDLPRAQRAMRRVQSLVPQDIRGYLGLGRVYLTEGDLLAARVQFQEARRFAPGDLRPQAFLATTDRRMGQYDRALAELEPLVRAFPQDRLLWFDEGMCYYLTGRFEPAARAFQTMLDIDPDDLAAHYNRMRCLRQLHRVTEARHEQVIYQMLREDDSAKQIGLAYLRRHPLADRETRTVHEHELEPVPSAVP